MMTNKGMIAVPAMTLNALKQMLFSNENGVDLSNIIDDLAFDDAHRDLTAIHVALVHKGITPEFDKSIRYQHCYKNRFYRIEFVKASLILNSVTVRRTDCTIDEHGDIEIGRVHGDLAGYSFEDYLALPTDVKDILPLMR